MERPGNTQEDQRHLAVSRSPEDGASEVVEADQRKGKEVGPEILNGQVEIGFADVLKLEKRSS